MGLKRRNPFHRINFKIDFLTQPFLAFAIRRLIVEKSSSHIIRRKAREIGMTTLREDGWDKVSKGITTVEEILRVTLNDRN